MAKRAKSGILSALLEQFDRGFDQRLAVAAAPLLEAVGRAGRMGGSSAHGVGPYL